MTDLEKELLEALVQIIEPKIDNGGKTISFDWQRLPYSEKILRWENARAAIAKARGES